MCIFSRGMPTTKYKTRARYEVTEVICADCLRCTRSVSTHHNTHSPTHTHTMPAAAVKPHDPRARTPLVYTRLLYADLLLWTWAVSEQYETRCCCYYSNSIVYLYSRKSLSVYKIFAICAHILPLYRVEWYWSSIWLVHSSNYFLLVSIIIGLADRRRITFWLMKAHWKSTHLKKKTTLSSASKIPGAL